MGVRGGHAISLIADASNTVIQECIILNTGNGGAASGAANDGGDAGDAIHVADLVTGSKIMNCTVLRTGVGGNGGASAMGGRGGQWYVCRIKC